MNYNKTRINIGHQLLDGIEEALKVQTHSHTEVPEKLLNINAIAHVVRTLGHA